jgi:hypothetical protein
VDSTTSSNGRRARKAHRMRQYYASLLMAFEWLIEVPQTLGPAWRVMARPEGKRCLLIASGCAAVVTEAASTWLCSRDIHFAACACHCMTCQLWCMLVVALLDLSQSGLWLQGQNNDPHEIW